MLIFGLSPQASVLNWSYTFCYTSAEFVWEYTRERLSAILNPTSTVFSVNFDTYNIVLTADCIFYIFYFSSMNVYLCALAVSDTTIILTAFCLFVIENLRHRSLFLSKFFASLAPICFPVGLTAQTLSVFLTVTAAVDCYVHVSSNTDCKQRFCSTSSSIKVSTNLFLWKDTVADYFVA